jgi:hypothetical protein
MASSEGAMGRQTRVPFEGGEEAGSLTVASLDRGFPCRVRLVLDDTASVSVSPGAPWQTPRVERVVRRWRA